MVNSVAGFGRQPKVEKTRSLPLLIDECSRAIGRDRRRNKARRRGKSSQ